MAILAEFSGHDIAEFANDFLLLLKMGIEIDEMYSEGNSLFYKNKAIFETCCQLFTNKYKTLILKPLVRTSGKALRIYFPGTDLAGMYKDVCIRIEGLVGVSNHYDPEVPASDARKVAKVLATLRSKIYVNYNPDSIILEIKPEGITELIYDAQAILKNKDTSPELKLCAYYALKDGYDRNISILEGAKGFAFHTRPDMHSRRFAY